jgi:hypothetical protein
VSPGAMAAIRRSTSVRYGHTSTLRIPFRVRWGGCGFVTCANCVAVGALAVGGGNNLRAGRGEERMGRTNRRGDPAGIGGEGRLGYPECATRLGANRCHPCRDGNAVTVRWTFGKMGWGRVPWAAPSLLDTSPCRRRITPVHGCFRRRRRRGVNAPTNPAMLTCV